MTAQQAPLSMGFSRQEHWSGLPLSLEEGHYSIIQYFDHITLIKMKVLLAKGKEKMGIGMAPKSVCQIPQM